MDEFVEYEKFICRFLYIINEKKNGQAQRVKSGGSIEKMEKEKNKNKAYKKARMLILSSKVFFFYWNQSFDANIYLLPLLSPISNIHLFI